MAMLKIYDDTVLSICPVII